MPDALLCAFQSTASSTSLWNRPLPSLRTELTQLELRKRPVIGTRFLPKSGMFTPKEGSDATCRGTTQSVSVDTSRPWS